MSYIDRGDWHCLSEGFPKDSSLEKGSTHIGMYLAWIINNGLAGNFILDESKSSLELLKSKNITGRDFLIEECDSKLSYDDICEEGLEFTEFYYLGDALGGSLYMYDYAEMFINEPMTFYDVEDTWMNYEKIKLVIDERYRSWKEVRKIFDQLKS